MEREHRLESVHLRILAARQRGRIALEPAAMDGVGEGGVEIVEFRADQRAHLRVGPQAIGPGERQQAERLIVGVAPPVGERPVGLDQVDETRPPVARPAPLDQPREAVERQHRRRLVPAEQRRMGIDIDLPRLHPHPAGRVALGRAIGVEALDETAMAMIPALQVPERQRAVADPRQHPVDGGAFASGHAPPAFVPPACAGPAKSFTCCARSRRTTSTPSGESTTIRSSPPITTTGRVPART